MFRRLWQKLTTLWKLAKSERASPREIGWAVAIGAFAGCTPAVGIHGPLALALATLFKKNRLFAWLGSRISNMVFLPFITIAEVQISHRVRTGEWAVLDREHAMDNAGALLVDWCLGAIPVGITIGLVMGVSSWAFAHRRDRRRAQQDALSKSARTSKDDEPASEVARSKPPRDALSDPESTSGAHGL